jgi:uncharacterized protein (TIGR03437 family)
VLEVLPEDRRQDAGVDNVVNTLSGARPVPARAGAVTILTLTGRNFGPDEFVDLGLNEENPPFELNGIRVEASGGKPLRLLAAGPKSITAILDLSSVATSNPSESSLRLRVLSERNGAMDPVSIATALPNEPYTDGVLRESSPCSSGPQIVFNEDGSRNNEQNPARVGTAVTVLATGLDQRIFARAVGFAPGVYTITARIPAGAPGGLSAFPSTAAGMKIEAWVAR